MWHLSALSLFLPVAYAAQAPVFVPPSRSPTAPSANYVGKSNHTLPVTRVVPGKAFDRFISIWMENTDFEVANSSATFRSLAEQGILLEQYYSVTHPSEPNYVAAAGGSFFGMHDDNLYMIPKNVSTIVDLLEQRDISWASYQENMPSDGFTGFNFASHDYLNPNASAAPYLFYMRKHNGLIIHDSVATVPERAARIRNFNDFAADISAHRIPQWVFITPNMRNDAHDTNIDFGSQWLEYFLVPLLKDSRFNDERTLILLTFDENESSSMNNRVFSVLLGGAVPKHLRGTADSTYYSHYSGLSTVQANWRLQALGRGDTNKTMSNVFQFVAEQTGYRNKHVTGDQIPLTNISGPIPGPLNSIPSLQIPFPPPDYKAEGAGGEGVFGAPKSEPKPKPEPKPKKCIHIFGLCIPL